MEAAIDVLAIDDDKLARKLISRTFEGTDIGCRLAEDGEQGLDAAWNQTPDVILLDVEMPGLNGYEVCDRLRNDERTREVPIVFLSGRGSLQERLQGYEAGGDDYLVKPFEGDDLIAKIRVLRRYKDQREELKAQYELAQKTAYIAMTGTNDLAAAMGFMEKSYGFSSYEELALGLFDVTDKLSIDCTAMISMDGERFWFSSDGILKPLETELLEQTEKDKRFFDFGVRTIVNYPAISLLVRNMPLDNMERYGSIKDLLPVLLSTANTRINAMQMEKALLQQSKDLLLSIGRIRTKFYHLLKGLIESQAQGGEVMRNMSQELNVDLLRMGLEEDQEEYLLNRIDRAIEDAMQSMDSSTAIHSTVSSVLGDIKATMAQQEQLVEAFADSQKPAAKEEEDNYEADIELF